MYLVLNLVSRRLFLKEASVTAAMTAVAPLPQPVVASNEWIELIDGKTLEDCTKIQSLLVNGIRSK
ncbi:MAG: hypothetical protein CMO77_04045 [Verrucomicrobiales bacterium]|nr:hypothetical protein [Verrucomicrobiales bacterium]